jgi:hypothetical protein
MSYGHFFDAAPFPSADNMRDFLRDLLLPTVLQTAPLPNLSDTSGLPYPSLFSREHDLKSALVVHSAMQALQPLPPGWECMPSSQEVERPRAIFIFPPPGWQPPPCSLAGAGKVAMVDLPFQQLAGLLELGVVHLGGDSRLRAVRDLLRNPDSTGVSAALAIADEASAFMRRCVEDLARGKAIGTAGAAAAAVAGADDGAATAAAVPGAVATEEGAQECSEVSSAPWL